MVDPWVCMYMRLPSNFQQNVIYCYRVIFTVVSDPVDQEGDCDEVGTAEVDLSTVSNSTVECTRHGDAVYNPGSCGRLVYMTLYIHAC